MFGGHAAPSGHQRVQYIRVGSGGPSLKERNQIRLGPRTKIERPATILLPNSVAAHDIKPDETDGRAKKLNENSTG
jgi:hypothetical protein